MINDIPLIISILQVIELIHGKKSILYKKCVDVFMKSIKCDNAVTYLKIYEMW